MKGAILLSTLVLFFLEGCVAEDMNTTTSKVFGFNITEKNPEKCENILDTTKRDTCFNIVAKNTMNSSVCERITRTNQKDVCYSGQAYATQNKSLCEKVVDSYEKDRCIKKIE